MLRVAVLIIGSLLTVVFTFQALAGWKFYGLIVREDWHHEPPVRVYRNQLLALTLAAIPFNVVSLLDYAGLLTNLSPHPTAARLILGFSAAWLGGLVVSSKCLSTWVYLNRARDEYERYERH